VIRNGFPKLHCSRADRDYLPLEEDTMGLEYSPNSLLIDEEDWVSLRDATMSALTEVQRMFVVCKEAQQLKQIL
jgi:hypothetical protein